MSNNELSMDTPSRMVRANKMGFDTTHTVYHGSRSGGFQEFDKSYVGKGIVGGNNSGGFYFASTKEAASYYGDYVIVEKESVVDWIDDDIQVYGEGENYYMYMDCATIINLGSYVSHDIAFQAGLDIVKVHNNADVGDVIFEDDKVSAYYLSIQNPLVVESSTAFRIAEKTAEHDNYDGIIAKDIFDGDTWADVIVVFNPNQIRSIDAAFNPVFKSSSKLIY